MALWSTLALGLKVEGEERVRGWSSLLRSMAQLLMVFYSPDKAATWVIHDTGRAACGVDCAGIMSCVPNVMAIKAANQ